MKIEEKKRTFGVKTITLPFLPTPEIVTVKLEITEEPISTTKADETS